MAVYRYQVVSVGWWRGKIKRWNNTFYRATPDVATNIRDKVSACSWPNPGDVLGACSGGVASISVYNATGGAPIAVNTYFDWQTPATWIPFTGSSWSTIDPTTPLDASGESALVIVGHMPGLSTTGKPITTRKYFHAIPSRTAVDYADPDIDSTAAAELLGTWTPSYFQNRAGVIPDSIEVEPYYLNHQRVRGRRRPTTQVVTEAFSAGVATGAAAAENHIGFSGGGSF